MHSARWGHDDCEVDLVEPSAALKPVAALEIAWSDAHVSDAKKHRGLCRFMALNDLPQAWATSRTQFGRSPVSGCEIRTWPAAVLAFHFGCRAVDTRLGSYDAEIESGDDA